MKKARILTCFFLAAINISAQSFKLSAGADFSWFPAILENQTMNDTFGTAFPAGTEFAFDSSYAAFCLRGFLDFFYGVVSVGYRTAISKVSGKISALGSSMSSDVFFSISILEVRLLGKYPFRVGTMTVFPLLGLESTACFGGKVGTIDFLAQTRADYSDISLLADVGGDFPVSQQVFLRPGLIIGYVLTSKRDNSYYAGVTYVGSSGWLIELGLGIGYTL